MFPARAPETAFAVARSYGGTGCEGARAPQRLVVPPSGCRESVELSGVSQRAEAPTTNRDGAARESLNCRRPVAFLFPARAPETARDARALPRSSCIETNVTLRLSHPVQFSFGAQHHDWPGTFLLLRVRGPFPPISGSRNMGPDPMERDSNGDVQNDASTRESSRAQTVVLSP